MNKYAQLYIEEFDKIAAGLGFDGMNVVKKIIRDFKNKGGEIRRVRPSSPAAVLPGTEHLPIGKSNAELPNLTRPNVKTRIEVGKGRPRNTIERGADGKVEYVNGVDGGTNPSPIASLLHEWGHTAGARAFQPIAAADKIKYPSWMSQQHGKHVLKGMPDEVSVLLDELTANNSAIRAGNQLGAPKGAANWFIQARYPSFYDYVNRAQEVAKDNPAVKTQLDKILSKGQYGYTPDLSIRSFYE